MQDPNLLVGFHTNDDAGVYRLTDDMALVTTADFITSPVNDPYVFGQITAANAISDVYAMGGGPITFGLKTTGRTGIVKSCTTGKPTAACWRSWRPGMPRPLSRH